MNYFGSTRDAQFAARISQRQVGTISFTALSVPIDSVFSVWLSYQRRIPKNTLKIVAVANTRDTEPMGRAIDLVGFRFGSDGTENLSCSRVDDACENRLYPLALPLNTLSSEHR